MGPRPEPQPDPSSSSFAPRTTLDLVLSEVGIAELRAWLRAPPATDAAATATTPAEKRAALASLSALVSGAQGSGLTTLMTLLAKEMRLEAVWVGTGTPRIKALLAQACTSPVAVNGLQKVVIVDEFDALFSVDTVACTDVLGFTKKTATKIVCLARSTRNSRLADATKHMHRISFSKPSTSAVAGIVRRAVSSLGLDLPPETQAEIVSSAGGNIRGALAAVEFWGRRSSAEQAPVADSTPAAAAAASSVVEETDVDSSFMEGDASASLDGLDVVQNLLSENPGVTRCLQLYLRDPSVLSMGLNENYTNVASDISQCAAVSESFSAADTVEAHMYRHQAWDVFEAYGAFAVAGPVQRLHAPPGTRPGSSSSVTKFGTIWSKMYNQYAKLKNAKAIALGRAETLGLCCTLPIEDLAYVRGMLFDAISRWDGPEIRRLVRALGGTAAHALALMRLWTSEYKQTTHGKLKKVLLQQN